MVWKSQTANIFFEKHQGKTYSISPFLNSDSVIAFPVQPSTPLDSTPDVIPPEFTPKPALSTANVDSSCPTIKSVNLEESNKGGLKSESIGGFLNCQKKVLKNILNYYILYVAMIKCW